MTDETVRRALMQAVGNLAYALRLVETGHAAYEVRDALLNALSDRPPIRLQTCPTRRHRDWWAEVDPPLGLECPWCEIEDWAGHDIDWSLGPNRPQLKPAAAEGEAAS